MTWRCSTRLSYLSNGLMGLGEPSFEAATDPDTISERIRFWGEAVSNAAHGPLERHE
jgi:hypothetical protein